MKKKLMSKDCGRVDVTKFRLLTELAWPGRAPTICELPMTTRGDTVATVFCWAGAVGVDGRILTI